MIIVLMGVSGCGKTTVGTLLAQRLGCGFSDADSFHPPASVEKMRRGIALDDRDRQPWLQALRAAMDTWDAGGGRHVLACSALKRAYRDVLSPRGDVAFVYLKGSADIIASRLNARAGHYFDPALLTSQFAALEEPEEALTVGIGQSPEMIAEAIVGHLTSCRVAA